MNTAIIDFFTTYILPGREPPPRPPPSSEDTHVPALEPRGKLFDLLQRVYTLHHASGEDSTPKASVISQAVQIWHELDTWDPDSTEEGEGEEGSSPETLLLYRLYKDTIFLWTYLIVHPDDVSGWKAQDAVRNILSGVEEVRDEDELGLFVVMPLFFGGLVAFLPEDRDIVGSTFEHLEEHAWGVRLRAPYDIVQRSWALYDSGSQRCWNWMVHEQEGT
ncbi:hypothetical protein ASPCAL09049 [Aspergillus calidoustus]|uniref:Uncharacterized protein n=1 Tax=Aspergillus calidoustus TaxID=454130 RepID=A0A0U5CRF4_ASPCI|nr:hypothetical protein ASPCAL09049 [Aspergillus calidoustus]